jgi:hypothetical protein
MTTLAKSLPESESDRGNEARSKTPVEARSPVLRPIGGLARALGKTTLTIALLLLLAFLAIWYITPVYLRNYLNAKGDTLPDYHLHIEQVQINPWNCSLDLNYLVLVKKSNKIPVPFFTCPRVHIAMQWSEIFHWTLRSRITLMKPVVNFVNGPTEETSQTALEPEWVTVVKQLVPLKINRFTVVDGDIHYYDFHADPEINMEMTDVEVSLDNLTNSTHSKALMPQTAEMTGRPFKRGRLNVHLALNVDMKQPTFAEKIGLENIPAPALNSFLAKYGSVYAKSGNLAFYSEMVSAKGGYNGYAKPFFQDLVFEPMPKDRGGLAEIWSALVNGVKDIFENDDKAVATTIPISGRYTDPDIDFFSAAFGVLSNAYFQALSHGFKTPEIAPDPEKLDISKDAINKAVEKSATPDAPPVPPPGKTPAKK